LKITRIEFTLHSDERQGQRTITRDMVRSAIKNGSIANLAGKGIRGGVMKKFTRDVNGEKLVVIAELWLKTCYVVTNYWQD
jgi:hypothetical protein